MICKFLVLNSFIKHLSNSKSNDVVQRMLYLQIRKFNVVPNRLRILSKSSKSRCHFGVVARRNVVFSYCRLFSWRRGSVVRMSVCSRRTFPDLRLIHGWRVTTLWVRRSLWVNQLGQLSLPSLRDR